MENCLVTKLNGVVQNDSLLRLGERRISFYKSKYGSGGNPDKITVKAGKAVTIEWVDGNGTKNSRTFEGGESHFLVNDSSDTPYQGTIRPIYYLEGLSAYANSFDIDLFEYSTDVQALEFGVLSTTEGTLGLVHGSIMSLANLTELVSLNINNQNVTGDIDEFAQKIHSNGRTSGTLSIYANNVQNLKYQGQTYGTIIITFSQSGYTVSV